MDVIKLATLSINGLTSRTRVEMLEDFLRRQDIHILFLQEVTHPNLYRFCSYQTHTNMGRKCAALRL